MLKRLWALIGRRHKGYMFTSYPQAESQYCQQSAASFQDRSQPPKNESIKIHDIRISSLK